jgi:hypothetical protein
VLAKEHLTVFIGDHGIRADERTRGRAGLAAGILDKHLNLSGRGEGASHISHHVAEPQVAVRTPERSFRELEAASDLFDLGVLRHHRIKCRIEANDASHALRLGHGCGRWRLGTANQQNCKGESSQSLHIPLSGTNAF